MRALVIAGLLVSVLGVVALAEDRARLIILADMGNEPDEMQQMAHMLVCSDSFDLEGLIAVTGKFLHPGRENPNKRRTQPELFLELIDAYEQVRPNLQDHSEGWPEPDYLRSITKHGQAGYGIADVGEGRSSEGARLILDALAKADARPIWVVVNAGSNTLAQALYELKTTRPAHELREAVAKLRVFENGSQDNAGAWITSEFPEIHWIRSNYQTYAYGGPGGGAGQAGRAAGPHKWQPFEYSVQGQHEWIAEHVQNNHGPLGAKYPERRFERGGLGFIEGCSTSTTRRGAAGAAGSPARRSPTSGRDTATSDPTRSALPPSTPTEKPATFGPTPTTERPTRATMFRSGDSERPCIATSGLAWIGA